MAIHEFEPTDIIPVEFVPIMIYGPPACGKTQLAQTAANPYTLDLDDGMCRIRSGLPRGKSATFDCWGDVLEGGRAGKYAASDTIIIDTGGRALESMMAAIMQESSKHTNGGALSISGWGVLGQRFKAWMNLVRSWRKQVVMVCHQEDSKDSNGNLDSCPDLPGKMAWKYIHQNFHIIGQVQWHGKQRVLDFSPMEGALCRKNAPGWEPMEIPDLKTHRTFLADLIADAKTRIGGVAVKAKLAEEVIKDWQEFLGFTPQLSLLNQKLPEISKLTNGLKKQVWHMVQEYAKAQGWEFDAKAKKFIAKVQPEDNGVPAGVGNEEEAF